MTDVIWIKFYIDIFNNPKIGKIRRLNKSKKQPDGDRIVLFWMMLLAAAGRCNASGKIHITENVPYTKEDLADEFGFEPSLVTLALDTLVELDMIEISDGFIYIQNWNKYQSEDKLAEIRSRDRERKRLKKAQTKEEDNTKKSVEIPRNFRGISADFPQNALLREEIEEEKEEEKKNTSLIHSINSGSAYVMERVLEAGFTPGTKDAEVYAKEVIEGFKLKYMGGALGKNVLFISDEQWNALLEMLSIDEIERYVGIVVECELNGKHYKNKTHFQAILDMAENDRKMNL